MQQQLTETMGRKVEREKGVRDHETSLSFPGGWGEGNKTRAEIHKALSLQLIVTTSSLAIPKWQCFVKSISHQSGQLELGRPI